MDDVENALKSLDITVYLSNKNIVNSCGYHVGNVKRLDVLSEASFLEKIKPLASHKMEMILSFLKNHANDFI